MVMHSAAVSAIEWIERREGMVVLPPFWLQSGRRLATVSCRKYLRSRAAREERDASLKSAMQPKV
jgi:hypothetical protein